MFDEEVEDAHTAAFTLTSGWIHPPDFADSAAHCGLSYPQLLHKIITLGLSYNTAVYVLI